MITGLNHLTIAVKDLEKSFQFYRDVLGFQPLMKHVKGAYFLAGDLWFCLDLDSSTRVEALPEYTHFAFSVSKNDFQKMALRIKKSQATLWKDNVSEGESLYFLDPDGHKLELHVGDWKSRIESVKIKPWSDSIEFFEPNPWPQNLNVRAAVKSEARFLSGLAMRSKSYWPYPADYLEKCVGVLHVTEDDIQNWPVLVAELDGEIIGFFALKKVSNENRLDHLWIDPRYIGKGTGKVLFAKSLVAAKEIGWNQFRIAADPYAEPFYIKMGAKTIGSVQSSNKPDLFLPHMEIHF